MKSSIRTFLLLNLLLAILITTTLTALGNYYLDQKDIQSHLDSLMALSALSYQSLLGDDLRKRPIQKIQHSLDKIPEKIESFYHDQFINNELPKSYINRFSFQVWSNAGDLLLQSPLAPNGQLTADIDGFSDQLLDQQKWRVFTTYNEKSGVRTALAERYDTRNELGKRIAQDDLYIMLLTFPLSGLLIWMIIGKGLISLNRVAKEVSNRAPSHLEPVNLEKVPDEIRPLVDELNKLFKRLHEGFEREKRFAGDAAHELKTPLAAIKAQAQVALNTKDEYEKNASLQKLIQYVDRGTHVVQQLLTISKIVPESVQFSDVLSVNIISLAREVLVSLAPQAIEKQIDLSLNSELEVLDISGNPTALSIMIRNLVDNAIRYSPPNSEVNVDIIQKTNKVHIIIEDTGPGIPNELKDRVFERFFRILGTKSQGSGLGLAIVQQIVTLHQGKIQLKNRKNKTGLSVTIILPRQ